MRAAALLLLLIACAAHAALVAPRDDRQVHGGPAPSPMPPRVVREPPTGGPSADSHLPQWTPSPCTIPSSWEYFAGRITALLASIGSLGVALQGKPAPTSSPFASIFSPDVVGHISPLGGAVKGMQANALYLETLPALLLARTNWTMTNLHQTHYAVTCGVVAMVHTVQLSGLPSVPHPQDPSTDDGLGGVRNIFRRLMHGVGDAGSGRGGPKPDGPPTPTEAPKTPVMELTLWSWFKFDANGLVKDYDLKMWRRGMVDWSDVLPGRDGMIDRICSAFDTSGGGACAKYDGAYASKAACAEDLANVLQSPLVCRYLNSFLVEDHPVSACTEMGSKGKMCSIKPSWVQESYERQQDAKVHTDEVTPKIPRHSEL